MSDNRVEMKHGKSKSTVRVAPSEVETMKSRGWSLVEQAKPAKAPAKKKESS